MWTKRAGCLCKDGANVRRQACARDGPDCSAENGRGKSSKPPSRLYMYNICDSVDTVEETGKQTGDIDRVLATGGFSNNEESNNEGEIEMKVFKASSKKRFQEQSEVTLRTRCRLKLKSICCRVQKSRRFF